MSDTTLPRPDRQLAAVRELGVRVLFSPDVRARGRARRLSPEGLAIGRGGAGSPVRWALDDAMASRDHALVTWDRARERFLIVDRGSRNGTQKNGVGVDREIVEAGDLLRVGDTILRVVELDPELDPEWTSAPDAELWGASPGLQRLMRDIARVAPTHLTVLVEGETGTGKDVVARALHRQSGRSGAFIVVNCAAIVESLVNSELFGHRRGAFSGATEDRRGLLARADGGTLLLDEIGELPVGSQAALLRVLEDRIVRPVGSEEERSVDVRFVCATNRALDREVEQNNFRADLYARICQERLRLSPLRERPEDLLPILDQLLVSREHRITADAFEAMALYRWPYNVRELVSLVRKVLTRLPAGAVIELSHLTDDIAVPKAPAPVTPTLPRPTGEPTKAELILVLRHFEGRVAEAARHLQRGRTQLYRWMKKHGIEPTDFR